MAADSAPQGASSSNSAAMASNPVALLSTRLAKVSLEDIARALGKDDTAACKIRSNERAATVAELARLIPLCGLKLVDKDKVCVDRQAYESMTYIASKAMADKDTAQKLIWDEGGQ
jgi:hypothetical protein